AKVAESRANAGFLDVVAAFEVGEVIAGGREKNRLDLVVLPRAPAARRIDQAGLGIALGSRRHGHVLLGGRRGLGLGDHRDDVRERGRRWLIGCRRWFGCKRLARRLRCGRRWRRRRYGRGCRGTRGGRDGKSHGKERPSSESHRRYPLKFSCTRI